MKKDIAAQSAEVDKAIKSAVDDELAKVLGSLSQGASKADMKALQAKAAQLQAQFGDQDADDSKPAPPATSPQKNLLDVPDDTEPLSQEDAALNKTEASIKAGDRTFQLTHCLGYARMEDDTPTKIILLSDKPLATEKLDKLCASGKSFSIYDGFIKTSPGAVLELRITPNSVFINLAVDGYSVSTNNSNIRSTVRLKDGKLQGRVSLDKPLEMRDTTLTFQASISEKVRR